MKQLTAFNLDPRNYPHNDVAIPMRRGWRESQKSCKHRDFFNYSSIGAVGEVKVKKGVQFSWVVIYEQEWPFLGCWNAENPNIFQVADLIQLVSAWVHRFVSNYVDLVVAGEYKAEYVLISHWRWCLVMYGAFFRYSECSELQKSRQILARIGIGVMNVGLSIWVVIAAGDVYRERSFQFSCGLLFR